MWQKLEEQNPEFFKAYHQRLKVKEQISLYNFLVSEQYRVMERRKNGSVALRQVPLSQPTGTTGAPTVGDLAVAALLRLCCCQCPLLTLMNRAGGSGDDGSHDGHGHFVDQRCVACGVHSVWCARRIVGVCVLTLRSREQVLECRRHRRDRPI